MNSKLAVKTQNDIKADVRAKIIALINQQLADACDLSSQIKQAHWNVKGPSFIGLHLLFDEIYEKFELLCFFLRLQGDLRLLQTHELLGFRLAEQIDLNCQLLFFPGSVLHFRFRLPAPGF